jgi:hypothetical protein
MTNHITHEMYAPVASPDDGLASERLDNTSAGPAPTNSSKSWEALYAHHLKVSWELFEDCREQHGSHLKIYRKHPV